MLDFINWQMYLILRQMRIFLVILPLLILSTQSLAADRECTPLRVEVRQGANSHRVSALDAEADTLERDDGEPYYVFRYPDVYGDDFRNQYFRMPETAAIVGVLYAFGTTGGDAWTTGSPDLVTMLWAAGEDSLPLADSVLLRDTLEFADFSDRIFDLGDVWEEDSTQFVRVDLSDHELTLGSFAGFNAGFTAIRHSDEDSLAILADDGSPETRTSSEFYNGEFVRMRDDWRGVNFLIRVLIESPQSGETMLYPASVNEFALLDSHPNPFNPTTTLRVTLAQAGFTEISVYDVLGREVERLFSGRMQTGRHDFIVDSSGWATGVYFVKLEMQGATVTRKILLEK